MIRANPHRPSRLTRRPERAGDGRQCRDGSSDRHCSIAPPKSGQGNTIPVSREVGLAVECGLTNPREANNDRRPKTTNPFARSHDPPRARSFPFRVDFPTPPEPNRPPPKLRSASCRRPRKCQPAAPAHHGRTPHTQPLGRAPRRPARSPRRPRNPSLSRRRHGTPNRGQGRQYPPTAPPGRQQAAYRRRSPPTDRHPPRHGRRPARGPGRPSIARTATPSPASSPRHPPPRAPHRTPDAGVRVTEPTPRPDEISAVYDLATRPMSWLHRSRQAIISPVTSPRCQSRMPPVKPNMRVGVEIFQRRGRFEAVSFPPARP